MHPISCAVGLCFFLQVVEGKRIKIHMKYFKNMLQGKSRIRNNLQCKELHNTLMFINRNSIRILRQLMGGMLNVWEFTNSKNHCR
jgi:hypothetical protein